MIILFHILSLSVLQLLRSQKVLKFFEKFRGSKSSLEMGSIHPPSIDLEHTIKFFPPVYRQRYKMVYDTLIDKRWENKVTSLVDFGCAEIDEDVLRHYLFKVYPLTIDYIRRRPKLLEVNVCVGSVSDPDDRVRNFDVVTAIELVEHLYPDVLEAFPYNVFKHIRPKVALVTTPNSDFNMLFTNLKKFRHLDHKFEWSRQQFEEW